MTRAYDAIVAGHICLDITPSFPDDLGSDPAAIFVPGRLINVGRPTLSTGGAVSNTGLAVLRMGLQAQLMAKVGDDAFGGIIRQIVDGEGAGVGMRVVPGELSSYTCVIAPPNVDRIFFHCPGCNDTFTADDVDYELVAQARLFHFGYPPLMEKFYSDGGQQLKTLMARVCETGATTSLDMAYPDPVSPAGRADWLAILGAALPHVGIFTPSVEEILFMLDRPRFNALQARARGGDVADSIPEADVRRLAGRLLEMGVGIVLIKCGARGLYLRTGTAARLTELGAAAPAASAWAECELWEAPFRVKVVSATGSGDCAIAGFLAGLLRGQSPAGALRLGVAAGARNVQTPDAISGMIPLTDLGEYAGQLSEKLPLELPADEGWTEDGAAGVWRGVCGEETGS